MVGEHHLLVGAMKPMRPLALGAMPEKAEARLGEDGMARAEGDELARGQSPVARERLEDVADVGVRDVDLFARHSSARRCERRFLSGAGCIHGRNNRLRRNCKRAAYSAMFRRACGASRHAHTQLFYHFRDTLLSRLVAACRVASRRAGTRRGLSRRRLLILGIAAALAPALCAL